MNLPSELPYPFSVQFKIKRITLLIPSLNTKFTVFINEREMPKSIFFFNFLLGHSDVINWHNFNFTIWYFNQLVFIPRRKQSLGRYIGITLSVCPSVHVPCKRNSS